MQSRHPISLLAAGALLALALPACGSKKDDGAKPKVVESSPADRDSTSQPRTTTRRPRPQLDVAPPDRPSLPPMGGDRRGRMMEKFDTDGDGALSEEERTAMREAMRERRAERRERNLDRRAEMMKEWDKDGDGTLSDDERSAMRAERITGMIDTVDDDGDGVITPEEAENAPGRMRRMFRDFSSLDRDSDGTVSREELEAAMSERRPRQGRFGRGPRLPNTDDSPQ